MTLSTSSTTRKLIMIFEKIEEEKKTSKWFIIPMGILLAILILLGIYFLATEGRRRIICTLNPDCEMPSDNI